MAKKNVHAIVSSAGWISTFLGFLMKAVFELGKKLGLGKEEINERIYQLSTPEGEAIAQKFAAIILGQASTTAPADWWNMFVAWLIRACEFVSYTDPNITGENFPYQPGDLEPKKVEIVSIKDRLRELGVSVLSTQQVRDYLDSLGYRPARLVELLWWWITNPTKRGNCLVAALGSMWGVSVPCVNDDGSDRLLNLYSVESDWCGRYEFAVVCK